MKKLLIKTTVHGLSVTTTLADPRAKPGDNKDSSLQVRQINNIPDNMSSDQVLSLFKNTIDGTAFCGGCQRFEFDFKELGEGKLIK